MITPDDLFDLSEMDPDQFFEQATGSLIVLATVAGYNAGVHPALALAVWSQKVAAHLVDLTPVDDWELLQTALASALENRAHTVE